MSLSLYVHSNPNRQAARERWDWVEYEEFLPWPPRPTYQVIQYYPTTALFP